MKSMRWVLAGVLLAIAACASPAGVWNDTYDNMDRTLLRAEIEKTLHAESWSTLQNGDGLIAVKQDGAGHETAADVSFADVGRGASFEMVGKSGHRVNWLTFGILGLAMKRKAIDTCQRFVETFQREHPHSR